MRKKKVTNEEVAKAISKMAEQVRHEMDFDFRVAQSQMYIAERELVDTLNEDQKKLYEEYRKKREEFYKIALEIYEKKF